MPTRGARPGHSPVKSCGQDRANFSPSCGFNDYGAFCMRLAHASLANANTILVPIYDARGRRDFMFTRENMQQLAQLPLYDGGSADLPADSLVTIRYATNEYTYSAKTEHEGMQVASLNVLFVILIGDVDRALLDDLAVAMAADN
jgi:hypothetical protein